MPTFKHKPINNTIRKPNGDISIYGFHCGYIQEDKITGVSLYKDGTYHVRCYNPITGIRHWNTWDNLTEARKDYKRMIRDIKKGSLKC
jgi:hypothetical protein